MNALVMMEHTPSAVAAVPGVSSSDKQLTAAYPPSSPRGALIAAGRAADARPGGRTRATDGERRSREWRPRPLERAAKCDETNARAVSRKIGCSDGWRRNDDAERNGRESCLVPTVSAALKSSLARARILPDDPTV